MAERTELVLEYVRKWLSFPPSKNDTSFLNFTAKSRKKRPLRIYKWHFLPTAKSGLC